MPLPLTIDVPSAETWVHANIVVSAGESLEFSATGEWRDANIRCGPEGYDRWYMTPFKWLARAPSAPWFALMGALDQDASTIFLIGVGLRHQFTKPGSLYLFANDAPFAYGNNSGSITLTISSP